jgi:hypothetical protein
MKYTLEELIEEFRSLSDFFHFDGFATINDGCEYIKKKKDFFSH